MISDLGIVIDGVPLLPSSGPGGIGRWTERVVHGLAVAAPDWRVTVVSHTDRDESISASFPRNVRVRVIRSSVRKQRARSLVGMYPDIKRIAGPVDAMLGSAFITWPSPNVAEIPVIHDLAFLETPRFVARPNLFYLRRMVPRSVARSSMIAAVSKSLREEVIQRWDIPPDRVEVVPGGFDDAPAHRPLWADKIPERFILSIATIEPRKNLMGALEAHEILTDQRGGVPQLVIAGMLGWRLRPVERALAGAIDSGSAVYLGPITESSFLTWLYERAAAFVFPSFYEGFGLPVLEAAARGCPVVISDLPPLREIVGGAGIFVDPHDPASIAGGIGRALADGRDHPRVAEARENARTYTWERSATAMRSTIERAVALRRAAAP